MAQTDPIDGDPNFLAIQAHIDSRLKPKEHGMVERKGSTSWVDNRIKPKDSAVYWKLCNFPSRITFGVRKDHAVRHNLLAQILAQFNGARTFTVDPSDVEFVGFDVNNDANSFRSIDDLINLFP